MVSRARCKGFRMSKGGMVAVEKGAAANFRLQIPHKVTQTQNSLEWWRGSGRAPSPGETFCRGARHKTSLAPCPGFLPH